MLYDEREREMEKWNIGKLESWKVGISAL